MTNYNGTACLFSNSSLSVHEKNITFRHFRENGDIGYTKKTSPRLLKARFH